MPKTTTINTSTEQNSSSIIIKSTIENNDNSKVDADFILAIQTCDALNLFKTQSFSKLVHAAQNLNFNNIIINICSADYYCQQNKTLPSADAFWNPNSQQIFIIVNKAPTEPISWFFKILYSMTFELFNAIMFNYTKCFTNFFMAENADDYALQAEFQEYCSVLNTSKVLLDLIINIELNLEDYVTNFEIKEVDLTVLAIKQLKDFIEEDTNNKNSFSEVWKLVNTPNWQTMQHVDILTHTPTHAGSYKYQYHHYIKPIVNLFKIPTIPSQTAAQAHAWKSFQLQKKSSLIFALKDNSEEDNDDNTYKNSSYL